MSLNQPTYEESLVKIANLEKQLNVLIAAKKGNNDMDDDDLEASFKKAMNEMKDEDKEKSAMEDENNKVKDAFKKAMEMEDDDDDKKEAMKKAMDMKDENDKKAKKAGESDPKEKPTTNVEHEAKIAATIMKKIPIMTKILEATKIIDPSNLAKVEKELTAATLKEVEAKYAAIQPYIAAVGLNGTQTPASNMPAMIPFQASAATQSEPDNIFEAGVEDIDFSKVKTSDIMGMYN